MEFKSTIDKPPDPFSFNPQARYNVSPNYNTKNFSLSELEIAVTPSLSIFAKVPNPLDHYLVPHMTKNEEVWQWNSQPLKCFQNQLNFAVLCASTGCGVSYVDHMNHSDKLIRSVYRFHFYFQVRRILSELQVPLPNDPNFHPLNNMIDMTAFQRICNEFNISPKWDFRQKSDEHNGLGSLYYPTGRKYDRTFYYPMTSFTPTSSTQVWLGSIQQTHANAWSTFVVDTGGGFTQAGVGRLNDSIRTYVYCVLGAQAQTKTDILGSPSLLEVGNSTPSFTGSTGFDAQKQLLAILEDVVHSPVDLPSSIQRYQDVLKYARSKLDFVVGIGLYMIPSDMRLQIGVIIDYNNKILIATESHAGIRPKLGLNADINNSPTQTRVSFPALHPVVNKKIQPTPATTSRTAETNVSAETTSRTAEAVSHGDTSHGDTSALASTLAVEDYESQKTAMIVGLIGVGFVVLYFFK